MFRIITTNTNTIDFFMLCDQRACGTRVQIPLHLVTKPVEGEPEPEPPLQMDQKYIQQQQQLFITGLAEAGWVMGMDAHVCPPCMEYERGAMASRELKRRALEKEQKREKDKLVLLAPANAKLPPLPPGMSKR